MIKCDVCNSEKSRMSMTDYILDAIVCNIDNQNGDNILDSLGDICPHCLEELNNKLKSYSTFSATKNDGYCFIETENLNCYLSVEDTEDFIIYLQKLQDDSDDEDYLEWKYESILESVEE